MPWANGCWPQEPSATPYPGRWSEQHRWPGKEMWSLPNPHEASWGKAVVQGDPAGGRSMDSQNHRRHHLLGPSNPNHCPVCPHSAGSVRRGRTHLEFLSGAREKPSTSSGRGCHGHLPICPPQAASCGSLEERSAQEETGAGLQNRAHPHPRAVPAPGSPPTLMGPGQGPAGCRGQSPHRQPCARSPTPPASAYPPCLLTRHEPPTVCRGLRPWPGWRGPGYAVSRPYVRIGSVYLGAPPITLLPEARGHPASSLPQRVGMMMQFEGLSAKQVPSKH
ncbi:unnamed protein product [Nyctereutes procyonoides]|uniref:(raccoon dog) hypothetical protein n=1 Tax=Nyctereutes procyonoides TaxID=34880 RepID=A0A811ZLX8_NYCPR|nr:unnamed protein product [Nyctereutes procyonoides]